MITRLEYLRGSFKERVLPHFPRAEERFNRYFNPSCELISALPLNGYSDFHLSRRGYPGPVWKPSSAPELKPMHLLSSDAEVAFTALGIKPMSLTGSNAPFCFYMKKYGENSLRESGLRAISLDGGSFIVFDPGLTAPILSRVLNRKTTVEDAGEAIMEVLRSFSPIPHDLFGYPEMAGTATKYGLRVFSEGRIRGIDYKTGSLCCAISSPNALSPALEYWAVAAASVEEILNLGATVSYASVELPPPKPEEPISKTNKVGVLMRTSVERKSGVSEWLLRKDLL